MTQLAEGPTVMKPLKILVPDAHLRDLDIERAITGDKLD